MKTWEIWAEGYITNGDRSRAMLLTTVEAETFQEACDKHFAIMDPTNYYYDSKELRYWACRLFDNGTDARRSFG